MYRFGITILLLVAACSQSAETDKSGACPGGGEELLVEEVGLCVYDTRKSEIIETGFVCPAERPDRTDFGDLIVCSDGEPPGGTADGLESAYPFANLGEDDCLNVLCDADETCVDGQCRPDGVIDNCANNAPEVCDDDDDNDCDGDTDCDDDDCASSASCSVPPTCVDTFEPNDTIATAQDTTVMPTDSALCGAADVDFWATDATDGGRILVIITLVRQTDVSAQVVNARGELVYDIDSNPLELSSANLSDGMFVGGGVIRRGEVGPFYVKVEGDEVDYQLSVETADVPRLGNIIEIGAGDEFTCALNATGFIYCWGRNDKLQIGDLTTPSSAEPRPVITALSGQRLWVGPEHSCALMSDGHPYCWGDNSFAESGPLMIGGPVGNVQTVGIVDVAEMALGRDFTCALLNSGGVQCWGANNLGQLGDPAFFDAFSAAARTVPSIADATSIAAGDEHVCVTRSDNSVWCWGSTAMDQLCDPMLFDDWTSTPTAISCLDGAVTALSVSAAGGWTAVQPADGYASGFGAVPGFDAMGGVGALIDIPTGSFMNPAPPATAVWAGANSWCRMESTGLVCMGYGPWLQTPILAGGDEFATNGNGVYGFFTKNLPNPRSVSLGANHHCAVESDGDAICWGYNGSGQLGIPSTLNAAWPVYVSDYNP